MAVMWFLSFYDEFMIFSTCECCPALCDTRWALVREKIQCRIITAVSRSNIGAKATFLWQKLDVRSSDERVKQGLYLIERGMRS